MGPISDLPVSRPKPAHFLLVWRRVDTFEIKTFVTTLQLLFAGLDLIK